MKYKDSTKMLLKSNSSIGKNVEDLKAVWC